MGSRAGGGSITGGAGGAAARGGATGGGATGAGGSSAEGAGGFATGTFATGGGATGAGGAGGGATGLAALGGAAGFGGTAAGGGAGRARGGRTVSGCCCWVMAFRTSPGREILERSNLVLISGSAGARGARFSAGALCRCAAKNWRTRAASSTSMELEWVFFSVTPTWGSTSRMAFDLTSSSRARSLIRIFCCIRPAIPPILSR